MDDELSDDGEMERLRGEFTKAIRSATKGVRGGTQEERSEGLYRALLLYAGTIYAAENEVPCEPKLFVELAEAGRDGMGRWTGEYRARN